MDSGSSTGRVVQDCKKVLLRFLKLFSLDEVAGCEWLGPNAQLLSVLSSQEGAEEVILVNDHICWNGLDNTIKYNPFIVFFMNSRLELISSNFCGCLSFVK